VSKMKESAKLHRGDFKELMPKNIDTSIVDLVIVDPPQEEGFEWPELLEECGRILNPGHSLFIHVKPHLIDLVLGLNFQARLNYKWLCILEAWHNDYNQHHNIRPQFLPWMWFTKGESRREPVTMFDDWGVTEVPWVEDTPRRTKALKAAYEPIFCTTNPLDIVCDPLMGRGTVGVVAIKMGRRFLGIEQDETEYAVAVERIQKAATEERGENGIVLS